MNLEMFVKCLSVSLSRYYVKIYLLMVTYLVKRNSILHISVAFDFKISCSRTDKKRMVDITKYALFLLFFGIIFSDV